MIAFLTGTIVHRDSTWLILSVGGVGYRIFVPPHLSGRVGDELSLYCSHQVREDSESLYGFTDNPGRALFELLLTVSGVGPKSALAIISASSADQIQAAIDAGDPALFESMPGIGKKVAAKIIVELRGKLAETSGSGQDDVMSALEGLGYRRSEIVPILRQVPTDVADISEKIRWALARLSK